jgi:hypothetical protein
VDGSRKEASCCGIASGCIMLRDQVRIVWMKCAVYTKEKVWQDHAISFYMAAFSRELLVGLKNMSPKKNT